MKKQIIATGGRAEGRKRIGVSARVYHVRKSGRRAIEKAFAAGSLHR
jgi:hypothetical protein